MSVLDILSKACFQKTGYWSRGFGVDAVRKNTRLELVPITKKGDVHSIRCVSQLGTGPEFTS
jgi:hypothetical protein